MTYLSFIPLSCEYFLTGAFISPHGADAGGEATREGIRPAETKQGQNKKMG